MIFSAKSAAKTFVSGQKGSVLIMIIVSIVIIATIGAAILTTTSSTMFTQIGSVDSLNGYFLAEGGKDYALNQIKWELANNRNPRTNSTRSCRIFNEDDCTSHTPRTFTLPNSAGQFSLELEVSRVSGSGACDNSSRPCVYQLTSIGMPNSGTNRVLYFEIREE